MKKLFAFVIMMLLVPVFALAADGSCVQSTENYPDSGIRKVFFKCTGSTVDGSLPSAGIATDSSITSFIKGYKLYQVEAYPTSGGTAPDAADVFILDADGMDLLGSEDGGATAYQGLNLIHATLKRIALPDLYIPRAGAHEFYEPYVFGTIKLKVLNQATVSANYTAVLIFKK